MNLYFTAADLSDAPVIFAQAKDLIDCYEDVTSIDYDRVLAWVKRKIESHICEYCCVVADGQKAAYYRLCDDGELDDLYVLPAFQGHGIGSAILSRCIVTSKENMYLYVFRNNIRAIAFYERFGFTVRESIGNTRFVMVRNG